MNPLFIYVKPDAEHYIIGDLNDKPPEGYTLLASIDPKSWFKHFLNSSLKHREELLKGVTL
jgi:hypothetical protein